MYQRFYGFGERPFSLLPDPDFLFLSDQHRTVLAMLELAICNHSGFCVVSGEIGAGKTTLIRELLNRLDAGICVGLVSNTHPSFGEMMQWVAAAFGLPTGSCDKLELHKQFIDFVIAQYARNKHTLLIVDEAQNLAPEALEELRMLSNVNSDKDFVLQIMLVGQPQLRARLREPRLTQFAQRIALDYHLKALDARETAAYIRHRLQHAGGSPDIFSEAACRVVARYTNGIPRMINRLCDLTLVYGYSGQCATIGADLVDRVVKDGHLGLAPAIPAQHRPVSAGSSATGASVASSAESAGGNPLEQPETEPLVKSAAEPVAEPETALADGPLAPLAAVPDRSGRRRSDRRRPPPADTPTPPDVDLYRLVVWAEQQAHSQRRATRRSLFRTLLVVLLTGVAVAGGWMTRDRWSSQLVIQALKPDYFLRDGTVATGITAIKNGP